MGIPVSTLQRSTIGPQTAYSVARSHNSKSNTLDGTTDQHLEHGKSTARDSLQSQRSLTPSLAPSNTRFVEVFIPKVEEVVDDLETHPRGSDSCSVGTKVEETDEETDDFEDIIDENHSLCAESSSTKVLDATRSPRENVPPVQEENDEPSISRYLATYLEADYIVHNLTTDFSRYLNEDVNTVFIENPAYLQDNCEVMYFSRNRMPFFCRYSHNYHS